MTGSTVCILLLVVAIGIGAIIQVCSGMNGDDDD